jgi:hypothetical protein
VKWWREEIKDKVQNDQKKIWNAQNLSWWYISAVLNWYVWFRVEIAYYLQRILIFKFIHSEKIMSQDIPREKQLPLSSLPDTICLPPESTPTVTLDARIIEGTSLDT